MKNLTFLLISFAILNCVQLIKSDELLELSCPDEINCKQFQHDGINASCIKGQCQCNTSNGESIKCQPMNPNINNIIGGTCPCYQQNAECDKQQKICYCTSDYMPSSDKRRCIAKMVALGEKCEQDIQCQKVDFNSACHESMECSCMNQFIKYEGKCASIVGIKSVSLNDSQCHKQYGANTKYSSENQHCICMPGHFSTIDSSQCLKIKKYLENCTENLQCIGTMGPGGICKENSCQCSENYYVEEKKTFEGIIKAVCTAVVKRGHYCRLDEDCYQRQLNETEQTMHCVYGECNCKNGFYPYNESDCVNGAGAHFISLIKWVFLLVVWILVKS